MREITMEISFCGQLGSEETITFEVNDDARNSEIIEQAEAKFEEFVLENCDYELYEGGDVIA